MDTMSLTAKYEDEMIAIRRHIHRHPELSNKEYKTTEFIREKLTEYGVEIAEIGMKTGVVAVIRGGKPGKTVAIREDIDALPMKEETGLPFCSINGKMHACGHDFHTSALLGAAKLLKAHELFCILSTKNALSSESAFVLKSVFFYKLHKLLHIRITAYCSVLCNAQ